MKYLYTLSILFILASCQKEEKKAPVDHAKTDWAFYKLEGNVKSVTTKSWQTNDKLEKLKTMHEDMSAHNGTLTFDESGMLVSEKYYYNDAPFLETTYKGREKTQLSTQYINNTPGIKTEYGWDKTGKNNTSITRRNADNSQIDRVEMKYQGNNLAQKITYNAQNNPTDKVAYIYDNKGNVIQEDIYLASEYVQYKAIYKYDKKNRKTSEARYDKDSKKHFESTYQYEGDNLMKKYTTNKSGELEYSEDYTYDKKGNVLTQTTYENYEKSTTVDTYTYDDKGNKVTWNVTKNGVLFMKASFTYDTHNNNTKTEVFDAKGTKVDDREYTFEYDKKGNWTKKITKKGGIPQFIAEREITYFEEE